jgi:predicted AAA+ superfamily ATPase
MLTRYLEKHILEDLKEKMVFVSGSRQVGKTTLARQIGQNYFTDKYAYLNWDNRQDRKAILSSAFSPDAKLFIFDELHKYKSWKNYLKGEYDKRKDSINILVTGSARLDIYRKGGDSLLGRFCSYRLHPLSMAELLNKQSPKAVPYKDISFYNTKRADKELFSALLKFGGFPHIFLKQSDRELRRWHNERMDRLIKEDVRDVENLRDLSSLQVLVEIIPGKVGSLFSLNSLREDLNVTHKTISLWVNILEKFYYHFRIYPFQSSIIKSLRKEPKIYLWDWSEVEDENARFENMVASHLLKFCHFLIDREGYKAQLYYLRDKEQREVDFLVAVDNKPWFCVEAKNSFKNIPSALRYFSHKLKIPFSFQVIKDKDVDFIKDGFRIISANKFLSAFV